MCRFVVYQGHEVVLADLLYRPKHSLVAQSLHAESMAQPFNADGFGIAWYAQGRPCVIKSATPAWGSRSLASLADGVRASHVFAHVRAASPGLAVQETNAHPFQRGRYVFMHNGDIRGFRQIKRTLQNSLSDAAWESIEGTTDSEHAFALFLDVIGSVDRRLSAEDLGLALEETLRRLASLVRKANASPDMACNFAVSDGASTAICRWSQGGMRPGSLHISTGLRYAYSDDGDADMVGAGDDPIEVALVASEPLTRRTEDWREFPAAHIMTIDAQLGVKIRPLRT